MVPFPEAGRNQKPWGLKDSLLLAPAAYCLLCGLSMEYTDPQWRLRKKCIVGKWKRWNQMKSGEQLTAEIFIFQWFSYTEAMRNNVIRIFWKKMLWKKDLENGVERLFESEGMVGLAWWTGWGKEWRFIILSLPNEASLSGHTGNLSIQLTKTLIPQPHLHVILIYFQGQNTHFFLWLI